MWLTPLDKADAAALGGKAQGLARLLAAGLPVPPGWVLDERALRALEGEPPPADLVEEIAARALSLGRAMVRSSATIEDGAAGGAAGVFSSREAATADDVGAAIRAVWESAATPLAAEYARLRGGTPELAVIVQRFVEGERITVYTRPPGAPARDEVWIQRGESLAKQPRDAGDRVVAIALAAERAIGAAGGADVELVLGGDGVVWIVQARPIVHPARRAPVPPPPPVIAALVADGRRWAWDVAHNPDPLSVAQASLVELVDRAAIAPWSMRVCAGYLYTAAREPAPRVALASCAELADRVRALEPRIDAALADDGSADLDAALARYLAFYAIWARELAPLITAARATTPVGDLRGARPSAIEAALIAAARGELTERDVIARFGAMSPVWDVATPTFAERPGVVRDAIDRTRLLTAPGALDRADDTDELARAGADLAERDDIWFARAQWLVRRALLARASQLDLLVDDVFWLPLAELRDGHVLDRDDARRRASAARAAAARAARWSMPLVVGGAPPSGEPLRGAGFGGVVTGRVRRFASLSSATFGRADVVVTRAVTPALAVFVTGCAALVSESGSLLDHGASLARELGIACVVGCRDAWSLLDDGMIVTVDGDAGTVVAQAT